MNKKERAQKIRDAFNKLIEEGKISEKLEDENAKFLKIEEKYYFTELLVNKLMHYAYLKGSRSVNEDSLKKGWDACMEDVAKKLGLFTEGPDNY